VLGHLVLADDLADFLADVRAALQFPGGDAGGDRREQLLGGGEEGFSLAGAFLGQGGVAAGDEPFAGEVGRGDLGEVLRRRGRAAPTARR
jgi:alpha-D-ribose 1-methylphosphonate 5-triphosphate synthase subunit PhnI